jgi:hypothetical protein
VRERVFSLSAKWKRLSASDRLHQPERKQQDSLYQVEYDIQREAHDAERQKQKPDDGEEKNHEQCQRPADNEQDKPKSHSDESSHVLNLQCHFTNDAPKSQFIESKLIETDRCARLSGFVQVCDRNCTKLFLPQFDQVPQVSIHIRKNRHRAIRFLRGWPHNRNSILHKLVVVPMKMSVPINRNTRPPVPISYPASLHFIGRAGEQQRTLTVAGRRYHHPSLCIAQTGVF